MDGLNVYRMVRNNPVRWEDKNGLMPQLHEQFDSNRGDLLFGLSAAISEHTSFWARWFKRADYLAVILRTEDAWDMVGHARTLGRKTLETYKEWAVGLQENRVPRERINDAQELVYGMKEIMQRIEMNIHDKMIKRQQGCCSQSKNISLSREYTDYLSKHERYSFSSTALDFGQHFFAPHESDRPTGPISSTPEINRYASKLISRGSKAALSMLLESTDDRQIHFLLDGLDVTRVILKSGGHSSTASELRYLYRNRDNLNGKVKFYLNRQEVSAPWVSNPRQWKAYRPSQRR